MKRNRRYFIGALLVLTVLLVCGCSAGWKSKEKDRLSILVWNNSSIEEALTEQFPDIDFDFVYYDGWAQTSELVMRIKNHDITDIFTATLLLEPEDTKENLLDLSGYEFCDNYESASLNPYDVNGSIYQLPGSMTIRCIIYNKEMFQEHGWKEPKTFGELTALCKQIREETDDITPIVFGGAAIGYHFTMMTTYAQTEFLYTPEGVKWQKDYLSGHAKAEDGFGAGISMVQELIDAGAFDDEKNADLWDVDLFQERMETGEAAMQFAWGDQHKLFTLVDSNKEKYDVMPYYNREGDGFLGTSTSYNISLAKRLGEAGNEKKLEDALRVMEWFATEEGISRTTVLSGSLIYPLKHALNSQTIPQFKRLWDDNIDGIKAPMLYTGYEDILIQSGEYIREAVRGEHNLDGLAQMIDEVHQAALSEDAGNTAAYVGSFTKDFTQDETVWTMAEILHAKGDSDITLVSDGHRVGTVKNREGTHSRFYEGPLIYDWIRIFVPGNDISDNDMVQMTLTGKEIQDLLEHGKHMVLYDTGNMTYAVAEDERAVASSSYRYAWAGMEAAWNGDSVTSMCLSDGTPVKPDQTYTVSFAAGDYMDTTAAAGNPVKLGYSAYDAFCQYMQNHSPVSPVKPQW